MQEGESSASQENENSKTNSEGINLGSKIKDLFGEEVLRAFEREYPCSFRLQAKYYYGIQQPFSFFHLGEDVINDMSISDLLEREADATIFQRLTLSYGKALLFKKEFGFLRKETTFRSFGAKTPQPPPSKPTMTDLQQLKPEVKQLYLTK